MITAARNKLAISGNGTGVSVISTLGQPSYITLNNFNNVSLVTGVYNNYSLRTVGISRSGNVIYVNLKVASNGASYTQRSIDAGVTWTTIESPGLRKFSDIGVSADGKVVAMCEVNGDVFISEDYGVTFTAQGLGTKTWEAINVQPDGSRIIASITYGYLWIYD